MDAGRHHLLVCQSIITRVIPVMDSKLVEHATSCWEKFLPRGGRVGIRCLSLKTTRSQMGRLQMAILRMEIQRFSVIGAKAFERVMAELNAGIGHPDMQAFRKDVTAAKTYADLERVVYRVVGPSGLMEFTRFDLGEILRKEQGSDAPNSLRLVVGNPLIMKQMVEHVPDAGSYAPVTILIDQRLDGVHLSYDRMTSFLAPHGNEAALSVARDLDSKVESLLTAAAA
jgi:uncharacterized protein (DUF302 family)